MSTRPNIVIINPDHFRTEALGHLGNTAVHTPCLDQLASEGASFQNAFCQNPVCSPSRCSFMSGWYPHVQGHRTMHYLMDKGDPVLLKKMKDAGYFVWWGGKNDLVAGHLPEDDYCDLRYRGDRATFDGLPRDWRDSVAPDIYFSHYYGELKLKDHDHFHDSDWDDYHAAADFIKNPPQEPYCLFLAGTRPHPPYGVEKPWYGKTDRKALPPRAPVPESWSNKPSMLQGIHERSKLTQWPDERWDELQATYYDMCSRVDYLTGVVLDALRESGQWDNTAVFFFSDHGTYAGDFGMVGINQNTFDDVLTNVPLIVKPPASIPCETGAREALVELVDFPATVFDMAGIEPDYHHFGKSLVPVLEAKNAMHRDAVFCEGGRLKDETHCKELEFAPGQNPKNVFWPRLSLQAGDGPEHTKAVMCRTREYKYVYRLYEDHELYDLKADPLETTNRIHDPELEAVRNEFQQRILQFFMETADVVPLKSHKR